MGRKLIPLAAALLLLAACRSASSSTSQTALQIRHQAMDLVTACVAKVGAAAMSQDPFHNTIKVFRCAAPKDKAQVAHCVQDGISPPDGVGPGVASADLEQSLPCLEAVLR